MTRKYKGPEWVRFNENDESTYPPIGERVLISYNTSSYGYSPSSVAWASLQIRYSSTYYWYLEQSTSSDEGSSPLVKSAHPYGQYSNPWIYVNYWKKIKPYLGKEFYNYEDYDKDHEDEYEFDAEEEIG